MRTFRGVLLFGSLLIFSINSNARSATGTMEGVVVTIQGRPVHGATVTIQTSDGQHPHAMHTDAAGHFAFTHFAAGQYDLRAYSEGSYSEWQKRVVLHVGRPTRITLRIIAKPPAD
jgi:hypothetical protein